jgi:hypothetical protein
MSEWKEGIWLGISALLTAMLITFAVVLGGVAKDISSLQQKDINTTAEMKEYCKWARYDNTIVNAADVIGCITANKSEVLSVIVYEKLSLDNPDEKFNFNVAAIKSFTWNVANICYLWDGKREEDYAFDRLNEYISPQTMYRAHVEKDLNGAVIYIWFKRIPMWSDYDNEKISGSDLIECIEESRYLANVIFELEDYSDSYFYKRWDEFSLTDGLLNELRMNIAYDGTYSAIIRRKSDTTADYVEFRRIN